MAALAFDAPLSRCAACGASLRNGEGCHACGFGTPVPAPMKGLSAKPEHRYPQWDEKRRVWVGPGETA